MITAIKADNIGAYKALFEEAADILSGYKRVRTFDTTVKEYFYKNGNAANFNELYVKVDGIKDLATFAAALANYQVLYVEALYEDEDDPKYGQPIGVAEGYEPMMGITTLEEYFAWIKNLGAINRKYTVLSLDEPRFEINANTRAINIPADFKKNGIAVQSDDLAEIVYFEIDRYFDYMDLNNCDIYIQWETPKNADGTVTKSVSAAYIRDIESKPGKLIFGWAISDAVTSMAGTLKFSVRFFQWSDPDQISVDEKTGTIVGDKAFAYSFSTLTANVQVQPSIQFNPEDNDYKVDDVGQRLIERLENSEIVGGYAAAVPTFLVDLLTTAYDLGAGDTFDLTVQANSSDTGAISYVWKFQELNLDNTTINPTTEIKTVSSTNKMIEVTDFSQMDKSQNYYQETGGTDKNGDPLYTMWRGNVPPDTSEQNTYSKRTVNQDEFEALRDAGKLYYKSDAGAYKPISADATFEATTVYYTKLTLFTRQSVCTATKAGVYWAVAENRITNSSASKESIKAFFLRPEFVRITVQPDAHGILKNLATEENPDAGFAYELKVVSDNIDGVLSYQWLIDENYAPTFDAEKPNFVEIPDATADTYTATEPGHYRVIVTNTRNLAKAELESKWSRVTFPAEAPRIKESALSSKLFKIDGLTDEKCPTIQLDETVESDEYSVSWFLAEGDYVYPIVENEFLEPGTYEAKFNPLNYEDEILAVAADGDIDGAYFAIVTNYVNHDPETYSVSKPDGSKASTERPDYENMFKITY